MFIPSAEKIFFLLCKKPYPSSHAHPDIQPKIIVIYQKLSKINLGIKKRRKKAFKKVMGRGIVDRCIKIGINIIAKMKANYQYA